MCHDTCMLVPAVLCIWTPLLSVDETGQISMLQYLINSGDHVQVQVTRHLRIPDHASLSVQTIKTYMAGSPKLIAYIKYIYI